MDKEEEWDIVIKGKVSLLELNFRELKHYKDLIFLFVRRDFVSLFKQTILGPLWFVIQPAFQTIVFGIIFGKLAGLSPENIPQPVFYMCGIILWYYFSDCLFKISDTFLINKSLFGKVYFPRLIAPIAVTISSLLKFCVQFMLFVAIFLAYYFWGALGGNLEPNWTIALIPIYIFIAAGMGLGIGLLVTSVTTKYRDLKFVLVFGVQLMMYFSTVIMSTAVLNKKSFFSAYAEYIMFNPVSPLIEAMRYAFIGQNGGSLEPLFLLYSFGFMVLTVFFGVIVFNKTQRDFIDTV